MLGYKDFGKWDPELRSFVAVQDDWIINIPFAINERYYPYDV